MSSVCAAEEGGRGGKAIWIARGTKTLRRSQGRETNSKKKTHRKKD
jgi:hypothetical protein